MISIRGSSSLRNWLANVQARLKEVPKVCSGCKVHTGFHEAMQEALPAVMKSVEELRRKNPGYTVVATGHSLGGAVATLVAEEVRRLGVKVDLVCYCWANLGVLEAAVLLANREV